VESARNRSQHLYATPLSLITFAKSLSPARGSPKVYRVEAILKRVKMSTAQIAWSQHKHSGSAQCEGIHTEEPS
jgi:hypothetical protein